ncbi:MAG: T9SS type A sorting domain-containing protein, partial [Candidatus Delongbacteria bacterium]|nr:T9SS type A sorting domain-containing protein [Candidatus Delongbacteria bacterium]
VNNDVWRYVVKRKAKFVLFIFVLLSFFSICIAEDFWMKLGLNEPCTKITYTPQDEIYLTRSQVPFYSYRSFDKGISWENYRQVLGYPFTISGLEHISDDGNYLYMYGDDTLRVTHKDSVNFKSFFEMAWMTMTKYKDNYFFHGNELIMKADENLNDTTIVFHNPTGVGEVFHSIAADSAGTLYAGSTDFMFEGGLYKSYDNGDSWIGPGPDLLNDYITTIAVDSEGRIFVGTAGHATLGTGRIYRSVDNGKSWQKVVGDGVYVNTMLINIDDEIFVGLSSGNVLHCDDNGDTWSFLNSGLDEAGAINDMAISPDGYIYLATDGGVYRSVKSTTGIVENDNLAKSYNLFQNYPNPFNNETNISFSLEFEGVIELSVFNTKGELVKNLLNKKMYKGKYMLNFNAEHLNSGVYFYQLKIDGIVKKTKSMLYLK